MTAEFADLYDPLLEWIYDRSAQGTLGLVDMEGFAQQHGLDSRQSFALSRYAKGKGTIDNRHSAHDRVVANLTPLGTEIMEERRRRRASPVARSLAARRGLLRWLWTQNDQGAHYPKVDNILDDPESVFEGARLTVEDIDRAAAHLKERNLIRGTGVLQRRGPIRAEITAEGQECVEQFDGDVGAHERRHGGTINNNYMPNAKGVIIGEQQHFTQNNTDGVDPTLFVQLAGYVGQISPTLGMPEPERGELERVAQDLHDEATSENPEPGHLRQFTTQLKDKLLEAGTTTAARMGVQLAEEALGALVQ